MRMTNEEAIKIIQTAKAEIEWTAPLDYQMAFDLAIEALEKQIPKEPIWEGDGYSDGQMVYDTWYCPVCDTSYEEDEKHKFCPNCGQAIDWEDEE